MSEPSSIYAGDTLIFDRNDPTYTVEDWTLTYVALNQSNGFSFAIVSGSGYTFSASVKASDTISWVAGTYRWIAYISNNSTTERHAVAQGTWEVFPDYATAVASGLDFRSHAKTCIDLIEAVIEGRLPRDVLSYNMGTRGLIKEPIEKLIVARDKYRIEYANEQKKERTALGLGHKGRILVRFT